MAKPEIKPVDVALSANASCFTCKGFGLINLYDDELSNDATRICRCVWDATVQARQDLVCREALRQEEWVRDQGIRIVVDDNGVEHDLNKYDICQRHAQGYWDCKRDPSVR
jgi:hypothetical protein